MRAGEFTLDARYISIMGFLWVTDVIERKRKVRFGGSGCLLVFLAGEVCIYCNWNGWQ